MTEMQTPAERRDDVIRTCETAVTFLTDDDRGWTQGAYVNNASTEVNEVGVRVTDYSQAQACLGGALVISHTEGNVQRDEVIHRFKGNICPAVAEVADTIRALPIERRRFVALRTPMGVPYTDSEVVVSFNDATGRTRDEVIDVVNDTIKRMVDENVAEVTGGE